MKQCQCYNMCIDYELYNVQYYAYSNLSTFITNHVKIHEHRHHITLQYGHDYFFFLCFATCSLASLYLGSRSSAHLNAPRAFCLSLVRRRLYPNSE